MTDSCCSVRLSAKLSELEEDEVRIAAEWTDYDEDMFRLGEQILVDRQEERQERPGETREEL